jgi:DNA-binding transcriptional regulator LsrR (DeoR family)
MNDLHAAKFDQLRTVRAQALHHAKQAQLLARERRDLMKWLISDGVTQSDIARELGVSRQAVQKMLAV